MTNNSINASHGIQTQIYHTPLNRHLYKDTNHLIDIFICITKNLKSWISSVESLLSSIINIIFTMLHNRNINKTKHNNNYIINKKTQSPAININTQQKQEGTHSTFLILENGEKQGSYADNQHQSKETPHRPASPTIENQVRNSFDITNINSGKIQLKKEKEFIDNINKYTTILVECLQSAKKLATKKASNETKQWFEKLKQQSKEFTTEEVIQASNKYRHISCPAHSSATKHNTYHANKINFKDHRYIAAQGPYLQNIDTVSYFIAMLAENESPVSISFVQDSEFGITKNTKLPPQKIGKTINIPAKIINGITIRKAITITMLNSIKNNANNLQVDILSINGKKHVRLYDLAWEDFTGGDLERLTAISLFTEYISSLPELKDRKNKPKVINCNAGIGRTGTAILIDHMSKEIESGKTLHENQLETDILHVRNSRPWLVEQKVQLETLRMFIKQGHKIIANIKARFNI